MLFASRYLQLRLHRFLQTLLLLYLLLGLALKLFLEGLKLEQVELFVDINKPLDRLQVAVFLVHLRQGQLVVCCNGVGVIVALSLAILELYHVLPHLQGHLHLHDDFLQLLHPLLLVGALQDEVMPDNVGTRVAEELPDGLLLGPDIGHPLDIREDDVSDPREAQVLVGLVVLQPGAHGLVHRAEGLAELHLGQVVCSEQADQHGGVLIEVDHLVVVLVVEVGDVVLAQVILDGPVHETALDRHHQPGAQLLAVVADVVADGCHLLGPKQVHHCLQVVLLLLGLGLAQVLQQLLVLYLTVLLVEQFDFLHAAVRNPHHNFVEVMPGNAVTVRSGAILAADIPGQVAALDEKAELGQVAGAVPLQQP